MEERQVPWSVRKLWWLERRGLLTVASVLLIMAWMGVAVFSVIALIVPERDYSRIAREGHLFDGVVEKVNRYTRTDNSGRESVWWNISYSWESEGQKHDGVMPISEENAARFREGMPTKVKVLGDESMLADLPAPPRIMTTMLLAMSGIALLTSVPSVIGFLILYRSVRRKNKLHSKGIRCDAKITSVSGGVSWPYYLWSGFTVQYVITVNGEKCIGSSVICNSALARSLNVGDTIAVLYATENPSLNCTVEPLFAELQNTAAVLGRV